MVTVRLRSSWVEKVHHLAMNAFDSLLASVRSCTNCAAELSDGVRPIVQVHPHARLLIAGQAPGRKAHLSGVPFDDASGDRLRDWMGVTHEVFYDAQQVATLPMGFCFPGTGKSGDLASRIECAPAWRTQLLQQLPNLQLTLVIGRYALDYHLAAASASVAESVKDWRHTWPHVVPLPHLSPRNNMRIRRNPWFEEELLPELRQRVSQGLL
jgi:uracil-DNA glycosylase